MQFHMQDLADRLWGACELTQAGGCGGPHVLQDQKMPKALQAFCLPGAGALPSDDATLTCIPATAI